HVQRRFVLAGLTIAGERPIPVHMESVSLVDAFVLADPDAGRQIDLNLDGSGAGHGLLHEHSGAKIFSADVQLPAKLSKTSFLPRAALRNETTGCTFMCFGVAHICSDRHA